jgi:hypothetical protein
MLESAVSTVHSADCMSEDNWRGMARRGRFHFIFTLFLAFQSVQAVQTYARDASQGDVTNATLAQADQSGVRIVFFTPADVAVPAGARPRLTKVAESAEKFYFEWMNHWGYPPAVKNLFRREADGMVEALEVKGDEPVSSGKYAKPSNALANDISRRAAQKYKIKRDGNVWWIFMFLGDRPARFSKYEGGGTAPQGGWAMVNYDSAPGEIRPDLGLAEGFNGDFFLKGTIHELTHAFGLPHVGPDPALGLGNTLMGPTTAVYTKRKYPNTDKIYLCESSAAMLWKHPFFSGTDKDRLLKPNLKLTEYKGVFDSTNNSITVSGKLFSDMPAHSVIVMDDQGQPDDIYWYRSHTARIDADGGFRITINNPPRANGKYWILFCFNNGVVTGDGSIKFAKESAIRKAYRFQEGNFEFDE